MKKSAYALVFLTILALSCKKDDALDEELTIENLSPEDFSLIEVLNEEEDVILLPSVSWEKAIDPEGDNITYSIYIDTEENPTTIVAENIRDTNYIYGISS